MQSEDTKNYIQETQKYLSENITNNSGKYLFSHYLKTLKLELDNYPIPCSLPFYRDISVYWIELVVEIF